MTLFNRPSTKKLYGEVVLIAGASSGIGNSIAKVLSQQGYRIYGTSRNSKEDINTSPIPNAAGGFIKMIKMDICSEESVNLAVDYVVKKEGFLGILINCAGFGLAGSVEDTSDEDAFSQFNTNFFGAHRICRKASQVMRNQGVGMIINIGSVAGLISIPFQPFYSASKYALEAMTDCIRMELKPYGIKASIIEPGDTKTGFTNNRIYTKTSNHSIYKATFKTSVNRMIHDEQNAPTPVEVVKAVQKIITTKNPPIRYVVGTTYKTLIFLKRVLPDRLVEFIVEKLYA